MNAPNLHTSQSRSAHRASSVKKTTTTPTLTSKPNSSATHESDLIDADQREVMIREAAYFRAESRGFCPGRELEDWLAAEAEIDRILASGELPRFCNY